MKENKRKKDIDALIANIQVEYKNIESLYNSSLNKKEIDANLKIKIKNYLENTRSVLDYCAHDIADSASIVSDKIYFPVVAKEKNGTAFEGSIGRNLSELQSKNSILFDYLESIQPYQADCAWLGDFIDITNDNKHQNLTPQIRTESQRIKSEHTGGGTVSWNPSAVKFGSGVFINGAPVNPITQMPVQTNDTVITKETWVDFQFNNSISALPLLRKIYEKIPVIVESIYKLL